MGILKKFFQEDVAPIVKKADKKPVSSVADKKSAPKEEKPAVSTVVAGDQKGVIVRPVVTEKSSLLGAENQYVFMVQSNATKLIVSEAIKAAYGIHPEAVRIVNVPAKVRTRQRIKGQVSGWKKAIIKLPAGKKITLVEGV